MGILDILWSTGHTFRQMALPASHQRDGGLSAIHNGGQYLQLHWANLIHSSRLTGHLFLATSSGLILRTANENPFSVLDGPGHA